MRIGIDARTLAVSHKGTSDRTYWRGLVQGLAAIDTENEYVLYTRQSEHDTLTLGPNFTWRALPGPGHDAFWISMSLPKALREDRIEVAHTQYNIPFFGSPCPIVTTVHDITFKLFPDLFLPKDRWILNRFVPRSMERACKVIAVSECTRRDILRAYKDWVSPDHVRTTLLAADPRFKLPENGQESAMAAANNMLGLANTPYVLAVGVLQPRKNLAVLLDAFALVKLGKRPPPHQLVVVGKRGWKNEAVETTLASLPPEVTSQIVWAGFVEDEYLPILYGGADAFCFPSLYEGFGLPPLEAMSCGCPVLCSQRGALPEVVGDAAIQLPPDNSNAWANALDTVLSQPATRARWRERSTERATHFSWQKTAQKTLDVYRECVTSRSS